MIYEPAIHVRSSSKQGLCRMIMVFRWMLWSLALVFFLGILAFAGVYYLASRSLPDYDGNYQVRGLYSDVEIIRDTNAVPHIFAQNDEDVFFGLGFAHAQDRLWQMTLMRRTAQGRLSELFGEETLSIDKFMRSLDIYTISQRAVSRQTPETIAALEAYSAGVNAWIEIVGTEALGRGAPEFFLSSKRIAPWLPADSIAVSKLLGVQMSDQASREVLRARLTLAMPTERIDDIMPKSPNGALMALPDYASLFPDFNPSYQKTIVSASAYDPIQPTGFAGASNAWAARGERSASGGTLLATDPHLPLIAPGYWMLARMDFSDGGAIGATIPGIPGILIGRNDDLGWGMTSSYMDDQDLVVEQLNPRNQDEYLTENGFEPFEKRNILIEIKDQVAIPYTLRWSRNGPVLPPDRYNVSTITPPGHVAVLSATVLAENDTTIQVAINLMRQKSVNRAIDTLEYYVSPSNNFTIADRENIALVAAGRMPLRNDAHPTRGRMPAPGWDAATPWLGILPFENNPVIMNPSSGIVVNTNNMLVDRAFPYHFSYDWGDTQRIKRATALLNERQFHTLTSFINMQTDVVSVSARTLLPLIARDLWWTGQPAATDTTERRKQVVLELLANWNGYMGEHNPEPLIYAAWVKALQKRLIVDELGQLSAEFSKLEPVFIERVFRDIEGASIWCDIKQTTVKETCKEMAELALDEALLWLEENYGPNPTRWRWGAAHKAVHKSNFFGSIPIISWFANITQETPGGDNTLLRGSTQGFGASPFTNVHGSGFRAVYDFSDPDSSVMIISTGQSGHLLSRHYDDLSLLWRRGEYIPMSLNRDTARGGAVGITNLTPRN